MLRMSVAAAMAIWTLRHLSSPCFNASQREVGVATSMGQYLA